MTPRDLVNSPTAKLIAYAAALGIAWATLKANQQALRVEVGQKADRADVNAVASDVRDIKGLLCRQYPNDSFCARRGP